MSNEYPARFPEGIKQKKHYSEEELETLIEFNNELIETMEREIFEKQFTGNSDWENKEEIKLANKRLKEYRKMLKALRPEESYSASVAAAAPAPAAAAAAPAAKKPSETQNALLRMIKSMTPPKPKAVQNGKGRKTRKSKSNKKSSRKSKR